MQELLPNQIEYLDKTFPTKAAGAFAEARAKILAQGLSVLQSENGAIYRVTPDGEKIFVKNIDLPVKVKRGSIIELL